MNFTNPKNGKSSPIPWFVDEASVLGFTRYMDENGCPKCKNLEVGRYIDGDICVVCAQLDAKELWPLWVMGSPDRPEKFATSVLKAVEIGADSYYTDRLCKGGPHFMQPHIKTGRCVRCEQIKKKTDGPMEMFPDIVIGREEARALGWLTYRSGEPCKRGHIAWRYVSNGGCLDCMNSVMPTFETIAPDKSYSLSDQMQLFIGYAWDGSRMLTPEGKRITKMQFNIMAGGVANYEVANGQKPVRTAHEAFMLNFGPRRNK